MDSFQSISGPDLTARYGEREFQKNSAFYQEGQMLVLVQALCRWEIKVCISLVMVEYAKGVFSSIANAAITQNMIK